MVVGTIEWYKTSQTFNLVIYDERIASRKTLVQFNQITYRAMRSRCVGYPTFNWNSCIYKTLRYTKLHSKKKTTIVNAVFQQSFSYLPPSDAQRKSDIMIPNKTTFFPFHRVKLMGESLHWSPTQALDERSLFSLKKVFDNLRGWRTLPRLS